MLRWILGDEPVVRKMLRERLPQQLDHDFAAEGARSLGRGFFQMNRIGFRDETRERVVRIDFQLADRGRALLRLQVFKGQIGPVVRRYLLRETAVGAVRIFQRIPPKERKSGRV